jgi:hypothetical protein
MKVHSIGTGALFRALEAAVGDLTRKENPAPTEQDLDAFTCLVARWGRLKKEHPGSAVCSVRRTAVPEIAVYCQVPTETQEGGVLQHQQPAAYYKL